MNETKVYADGYFQSFAGEGDFLSFLKSRKDKTTWKKRHQTISGSRRL